MYKKAILLAYTLACFSFLAIACSDSEVDETGKEPILPQIEVSKVATENGKTYLEVDGKPFPLLGAQIRLDALLNCDKMSINEVENYFKKAQELGVNCVQIPISVFLPFSPLDKAIERSRRFSLLYTLIWTFTTGGYGGAIAG